MTVWGLQKGTLKMKGKRHTTAEKIRVLREADGGKSIIEVCKDRNM